MTETNNYPIIEKVLIDFFTLQRDNEKQLMFKFGILGKADVFYFIPTHADAKAWIMKIIRCYREKEYLSFSYELSGGEVKNILNLNKVYVSP